MISYAVFDVNVVSEWSVENLPKPICLFAPAREHTETCYVFLMAEPLKAGR
jgi:hypothetical protein